MTKRNGVMLAAVLAVGGAAPALAADTATLDRLVEYAKQGCLVGTQYDLHFDEKGTLSFKDLRKPGEEIRIDARASSSAGATAIFDQQMRMVADKQVQECMKPYIDKIFAAALDPAAPSPMQSSSPYSLVVPKAKTQLVCND